MRLDDSHKPLWLVLAAVLGAACVWLYAQRVLINYQIADAAAHDRPRGNLSDLYPSWLGARELLLHGRDPYSFAVTREIQQGYYGRPLDPVQPGDPRDQQRFAYPVYVVFCLAPTIDLPFEIVRSGFFWLLFVLTAATLPLWLRVLRWPVPLWAQASLMILTVGSLSVMQGLELQQLTLLVAALIAIALALLASGRPVAGGIVLALTTIKPQLVFLLLLWLMIWTIADWRRRYLLAASFLLAMAVLFAASEWYLPHWIPRFVQAIREYRNYTDSASILDKLVSAPAGWVISLLAVLQTLHIARENRRVAADSPEFGGTAALGLAVTVVVMPNYHLYNQVLLLPALIVILRDRQRLWARNRVSRILLGLVAVFLGWQWCSSIVLAALSFILPRAIVDRAWSVPLWTALPLPVAVVAMILAIRYQETFTTSTRPGSS
jgi:Glycosyltransferase family 87